MKKGVLGVCLSLLMVAEFAVYNTSPINASTAQSHVNGVLVQSVDVGGSNESSTTERQGNVQEQPLIEQGTHIDDETNSGDLILHEVKTEPIVSADLAKHDQKLPNTGDDLNWRMTIGGIGLLVVLFIIKLLKSKRKSNENV